MSSVGIIANPASGKDIRRLVAHASTFDNNEKINIVRRVLLGLAAAGVERVYYMPDTYAIVPRAAEEVALDLELNALSMAALGTQSDSVEAGRRLADLGVGCIVTLGGDGTNRVVATGCGPTPLVAISTGTNNVFPRMIEGTLAGLAAGVVASGMLDDEGVIRQVPWLDVYLDGALRDHALIDVATSRQPWIGSRALWQPSSIAEVVLSRASTTGIGLCSLGPLLFPDTDCQAGAHILLGEHGQTVRAALGPGLVRPVTVQDARLLRPGSRVRLASTACTVALDGEREIDVARPGRELEILLNPAGPRVVDIDVALHAGARRGVFAY